MALEKAKLLDQFKIVGEMQFSSISSLWSMTSNGDKGNAIVSQVSETTGTIEMLFWATIQTLLKNTVLAPQRSVHRSLIS